MLPGGDVGNLLSKSLTDNWPQTGGGIVRKVHWKNGERTVLCGVLVGWQRGKIEILDSAEEREQRS